MKKGKITDTRICKIELNGFTVGNKYKVFDDIFDGRRIEDDNGAMRKYWSIASFFEPVHEAVDLKSTLPVAKDKYQLLYMLIAIHGWKADVKQNPPSIRLRKTINISTKYDIVIDFDNKIIIVLSGKILAGYFESLAAEHGFKQELPKINFS